MCTHKDYLETIKKSYKKIALLIHPDKNSNSNANLAFHKLNEAFKYLSSIVEQKNSYSNTNNTNTNNSAPRTNTNTNTNNSNTTNINSSP